MIKINLLGLKKEVKKSSVASAPVSLEGAKLVIFGVVFLAAGLGYVAWRHINLTNEADQIAKDMDGAKKEATRLASVKVQVEQLEGVKRNLVRQIDVIEGLERGRTGPVQMLNTMANTVVGTKTMWLTSFDSTGPRITLTGVATSMTTVSDFLKNMAATGQFENIEMRETAQDDKVKEIKAFNFQISATVVKPPQADAAAAPQTAGRGK